MVTLHEVITFLVSMQISISSLQTHNVNRCGRSRHLARKLSLRRKRSSPNVFEMAATETITSIILIKLIRVRDRKSGSAGMPRPTSYAVFCLKKKNQDQHRLPGAGDLAEEPLELVLDLGQAGIRTLVLGLDYFDAHARSLSEPGPVNLTSAAFVVTRCG